MSAPRRSGAAEALYRLLLLLLPRRFRREAADELVEVFRDGRAHAARAGRPALLRFWVRAVADVLVTAVVERTRTSGPSRREARGRGVLRALRRDLVFSARRLTRRPGPTFLAAGTLGVGVGAALVMVVLVRDVLLHPLPLQHPHRLVRLLEVSEARVFWPSYPNFQDWRRHAESFEGMLAVRAPEERPVVLGDHAVRVPVGALSRGALDVLGLAPAIGRGFSATENRPGGPAVALVSRAFWLGPLGGAPLDHLSFTLGDEVWRVVGVLPSDFRFLSTAGEWGDAAVWTPLERSTDLGPRSQHGYHVVGRLAPGVTLEEARVEMAALSDRLKAMHGEPTHADRVRATPLLDVVVADVREPLQMLLLAALGVLAVACLNVAASLVARGLARRREIAIRSALGAGRGAVAGQLLLESAMVALPALLAGTALAWIALQSLARSDGGTVPRLAEVGLDAGDIAVASVLALAAALAAGIAPALRAARHGIHLRAHGVGHRVREDLGVWRGFVAAQVALTVVLIIGSGLLLRSFIAALSVDRGYRVDDVLTVDIVLPEALYQEPEKRLAFYDEVLRRTRGLPGVEEVGLTNILPHEPYTWAGTTHRPSKEQRAWASFRWVSGRYLAVIDVPHLRGAALPTREMGTTTSALIDRNLAGELWEDDEDPVGDELDGGTRIVGIVGSVRQWNEERGIGAVYLDYHTAPERLLSTHLLVRGGAGPGIADAVRQVIASVDPLVPIDIRPLPSVTRQPLAPRRLMLGVAVAFTVLTLLLAGVGIYAVVSFAVGRERRNAAVRLALGADPSGLRRDLVEQGIRPVGVGLLLGLLAAVPAGIALRSQLFGVDAFDPAVHLAGATLMAVIALAASWIPARRIERVAPAAALVE